MAKILITGGSGLIGKALTGLLLSKGHQVAWLTRQVLQKPGFEIQQYLWDPGKGTVDLHAFKGTDVLVHLAGASIAGKRWTDRYKREILQSRVGSSALLLKAIQDSGSVPKAFIGCSAVGYYGNDPIGKTFTENDPPGRDFLAEVCIKWEKSYEPFSSAGIRTCIVRTGVVLSTQGGVYRELYPNFKKGLGAVPGSGEQFLPWIHVEDAAGIYAFLIEHELSGVFNCVANEHVNMKRFCTSLAASFNRKIKLPNIPPLALKLVLGEASEMVTKGSAMNNSKIRLAGFNFRFTGIDEALKDLAGRIGS